MVILRRLFLGLFLGFFCLVSGTAQAARMDDCFSYETPRIAIIPFQDTPHINTSVGLTDIRNIYGFSNKSPQASLREVPVGVTAASLQIESTLEITTRTPSDDSLACAQITGIDFRVGFSDTMIYVARELPIGTCSYQSVLDHEFKHVETDRLFLNDMSRLIAEDLSVTLRKIGRVRGSSVEIAKNHLQRDIDDYTSRLSNILTKMREERQKDVDSPQEYERISSSCNGDIRRLIGQHLP